MRLALFALALLAGLAVMQGLVYPVASAAGRALGLRVTFGEWILCGALVVAHVLLLKQIERRPWRDVGLDVGAARPDLLARGALVGLLPILVPSLLLIAIGVLDAQDAAEPGGTGAWLDAAGRILWVLVPAAMFEELAFRGYPFLVLQESVGRWAAVLVTSLAFGLIHAANPGATVGSVLVVAVAGIFLAAVRLGTGSLWAAFVAHLAWNFALSGVLHAAVSGSAFPSPGYRVVDAGPDWLTGGAWGPEGGAGAVAGMLAVTWWYRRALPVGRRAAPSAA